MGRRNKSRGRPVDGILVLDKPVGLSSNEALQRAKRFFRAAKAGHTGSLDPLATGVLPLCFGEATKFSQFLLDSDKRYRTTFKLGIRTATGDADGDVISERPVEGLTLARIEEALDTFRGEIDQIPSMYSAVKHQGQPLYKLARQGIEVERKSRRVTVFENRLIDFSGTELELEIHCSKGTYIRNIAEDLGELLGTGAHVCALRRLQAGPYLENQAYSLEELEALVEDEGLPALDACLLPVGSSVSQWPMVMLTDITAHYVRQGQPVIVPRAPQSGWVRLAQAAAPDTENNDADPADCVSESEFIGVGEVLDDGRVAPRRLITQRREQL